MITVGINGEINSDQITILVGLSILSLSSLYIYLFKSYFTTVPVVCK